MTSLIEGYYENDDIGFISYVKNFWKADKSIKLFYLFFGFIWSQVLLNHMNFLVQRIPVLNLMGDSYQVIILLSLLLASWRKVFAKISIVDIIIVCALILFYWGTSILYPITIDFVTEQGLLVSTFVIPMFLAGVAFKYSELKPTLVNFSRITIVFNTFYYLFYLQKVLVNHDIYLAGEQMVAAYETLPHTLLITYVAMDRRNILDIGLALLGFVMICSFGTRGPLVSIVLFVCLYSLFFLQFKHNKLIKSGISLLGLSLYYFIDEIALFFFELSDSLGLSNRIWAKLLDKNIDTYGITSGRNNIYPLIVNKVTSESPLFGFGLGQDRVATGGFYSHNIFLELLYSFGYFLGGLLSLGIIYIFISFFKSEASRETKIMGLVMFCSSFMQLFFSGSFITTAPFFLLLGYCVGSKRIQYSE